MDIGPVAALRTVTMIRSSPEVPELTRVSDVAHLGKSRDDEHSPADRGLAPELEDEDEAEPEPVDGNATVGKGPASGGVSLFA